MKSIHFAVIFFLNSLLGCSCLYAQKDSFFCKVTMKELDGAYLGGCNYGLASGQGEAWGSHHYKGSFKDGMPNGTGIYYYDDSVYYDGNFQDGKKEGKGEMHYPRKAKPDSIIKGYWSGDEFRGKKYITYSFTTTEQFDNTEITPSNARGNTVTFEIGTTSGSPNGTSLGGYVLTIMNLVSPTASIQKMLSKQESSFKSYMTYELISFPCTLFGSLSDGQTFQLELYKAANWKVRLYKNK